MTPSFTALPTIDLTPLSSPCPSSGELTQLSQQLDHVFATTGFAYLINPPLSLSHEAVFGLAKDFFSLPPAEKMRLAKKTFVKENSNTYRGYFPPQPGELDNLKEGFEFGPPHINPSESLSCQTRSTTRQRAPKFNLSEPNVWPDPRSGFTAYSRAQLEQLHGELQSLSARILSLLAVSLGKSPDHFVHYLDHSLSTLRLLHYPTRPRSDAAEPSPQPGFPEHAGTGNQADGYSVGPVTLCCTPHTDSGLLTLLHQDPTAPGLEVFNSHDQTWIPAPYLPDSLVVNIGDLMQTISRGRWVATLHRVRAAAATNGDDSKLGRISVPFFFEPGEDCVVRDVFSSSSSDGVKYGDHVRSKMATWVEFRDDDDDDVTAPTEMEASMVVKDHRTGYIDVMA